MKFQQLALPRLQIWRWLWCRLWHRSQGRWRGPGLGSVPRHESRQQHADADHTRKNHDQFSVHNIQYLVQTLPEQARVSPILRKSLITSTVPSTFPKPRPYPQGPDTHPVPGSCPPRRTCPPAQNTSCTQSPAPPYSEACILFIFLCV